VSAIPTLTIGERVAFYRRRRGLSQVVLADRVGRTESWIEKVERGRAQLDRLSMLSALANALDVSPADLIGDGGNSAVRAEPTEPARPLLRYDAINPRFAPDTQQLPPERLLPLIDSIWTAYQDGRLSYSIARLNQALPAAFAAAQAKPASSQDFSALAYLYHAAASALTKSGDIVNARLCAERGDDVGQRSGDTITMLSLQRSLAHTSSPKAIPRPAFRSCGTVWFRRPPGATLSPRPSSAH
jgi:transcriptional regulator with XRE-family HTH domain